MHPNRGPGNHAFVRHQRATGSRPYLERVLVSQTCLGSAEKRAIASNPIDFTWRPYSCAERQDVPWCAAKLDRCRSTRSAEQRIGEVDTEAVWRVKAVAGFTDVKDLVLMFGVAVDWACRRIFAVDGASVVETVADPEAVQQRQRLIGRRGFRRRRDRRCCGLGGSNSSGHGWGRWFGLVERRFLYLLPGAAGRVFDQGGCATAARRRHQRAGHEYPQVPLHSTLP